MPKADHVASTCAAHDPRHAKALARAPEDRPAAPAAPHADRGLVALVDRRVAPEDRLADRDPIVARGPIADRDRKDRDRKDRRASTQPAPKRACARAPDRTPRVHRWAPDPDRRAPKAKQGLTADVPVDRRVGRGLIVARAPIVARANLADPVDLRVPVVIAPKVHRVHRAH